MAQELKSPYLGLAGKGLSDESNPGCERRVNDTTSVQYVKENSQSLGTERLNGGQIDNQYSGFQSFSYQGSFRVTSYKLFI